MVFSSQILLSCMSYRSGSLTLIVLNFTWKFDLWQVYFLCSNRNKSRMDVTPKWLHLLSWRILAFHRYDMGASQYKGQRINKIFSFLHINFRQGTGSLYFCTIHRRKRRRVYVFASDRTKHISRRRSVCSFREHLAGPFSI